MRCGESSDGSSSRIRASRNRHRSTRTRDLERHQSQRPVDLLFDEADKRGPVDAVGFSPALGTARRRGRAAGLFHRIAVIGAVTWSSPRHAHPCHAAAHGRGSSIDYRARRQPHGDGDLALIADAGNDRNAWRTTSRRRSIFPRLRTWPASQRPPWLWRAMPTPPAHLI